MKRLHVPATANNSLELISVANSELLRHRVTLKKRYGLLLTQDGKLQIAPFTLRDADGHSGKSEQILGARKT